MPKTLDYFYWLLQEHMLKANEFILKKEKKRNIVEFILSKVCIWKMAFPKKIKIVRHVKQQTSFIS